MGSICPCLSSGEELDEGAKREIAIGKDIDNQLRKERAKKSEEHRILILGCGEAGKSTFIKQMEIIHAQGLGDDSARLEKKTLIAGNIVSAMGTLVREMSFVQENQLHDIEELSEAVGRLSRMPNFPQENTAHAMRYDENLVLDRADDIKLIWDSEPIQTTYKRRNEFQIVECARYFLSKVHDVMQPTYVPSDDDILQIRVQTTGIVEHEFLMKGGGANRRLIMIDVGGQRTERKKWIHFFDDVKVLMFLAAISEYDQVLAEDGRTNRLKESVNLFHTILNYQWFKTTHCVLFLNKKDLLEEKIKSGRNPPQNFFPDCPSNEYPVVEEYFKKLFIDQNPNPEVRDIYPHVTCATDQNNIKVVDTAVQVVIMRIILGELGVS